MTTHLTNAQFRAAKAALTRAMNSGDPQRVIDHVAATFDRWDRDGVAYPDDWHRWQMAAYDARMEQAYA
jgi:hypothetical protein